MSILNNLFGGGNKNNPNDAANKYIDQIPGEAHNTYDPYINQGKESGQNAHDAFEEMMKDPQGFINKIMGGYNESDQYKYQKEKLGTAMSNTAAAGGIAGTPLDQQNQGEAIQKLLSADQQQWLQNVLGRYDTGLTGEQGEATRGYDASGKLNDITTSNLNQKGTNAFNDAQQKNSDKSALISALVKALGGAAGGAFGGPAGAAGGAGIADWLSKIFGGGEAGPTSGTTNAPWSNPG